MDFDALTLTDLRRRQSVKWQLFGPEVLPMWVAELDVPLAPCVTAALERAVADGDTGYPTALATDGGPGPLAQAFAGFAERRWGWRPDLRGHRVVADVMTGVVEVLQVVTSPGDGVVICPPVYHPFFLAPPLVGRTVVEVPLVAGALDLAGIDAAIDQGATAVLLCSPHNPTGRVWSADELTALDEVVRGRAVVLADEIHAPLTLLGATFTPYLLHERDAVCLTSASKAFNLAGLKAALVVGGSDRVRALLDRVPLEVSFKSGHLGGLAGTAALTDGDDWLDALLQHLDRQRTRVGAGLPAGVTWEPPQAGYLAWLRCPREAPAARALTAGLALVEGTDFGAAWTHHARLNFGTTTAVLDEGLRRLGNAEGPPHVGRA